MKFKKKPIIKFDHLNIGTYNKISIFSDCTIFICKLWTVIKQQVKALLSCAWKNILGKKKHRWFQPILVVDVKSSNGCPKANTYINYIYILERTLTSYIPTRTSSLIKGWSFPDFGALSSGILTCLLPPLTELLCARIADCSFSCLPIKKDQSKELVWK